MGFLGKNPAKGAMPYLDQIPGKTQPYYQPYYDTGTKVLPHLQGEYGGLIDNPGKKVNKIGEDYQNSPGFKNAMEEAMMAATHAAAAGGMAGTPQHQYNAMQYATELANKDYNNWLNSALGLYGEGLHGEHGLANMGQKSGEDIADMISQALSSQAGYSYGGQAAKNQQRSGLWNNIGSAVGSITGWW